MQFIFTNLSQSISTSNIYNGMLYFQDVDNSSMNFKIERSHTVMYVRIDGLDYFKVFFFMYFIKRLSVVSWHFQLCSVSLDRIPAEIEVHYIRVICFCIL